MTTSLPPSWLATLRWQCGHLNDLSPLDIARIYRLRQEVFVIEQNCVYLDADAADEQCLHLIAWSDEDVLPMAYARLVGPGVNYAEPSMGRVITSRLARGTGLGRELVRRVMALSAQEYPGQGVRISAQAHLQRFYGEAGFVAVGEEYLEDDIPHIEMVRPG